MSRKEVPIGDNIFYLRKYDAFYGLELFGDLQQRLGAPFLAALEAADDVGNMDALKAGIAGIGRVSGVLSGAVLRDFARRILHPDYISVSVNGAEPRKLDEQAIGLAGLGAEDLAELCAEALEFQFAPFFARFAARYSGALSRLRSLSGSSLPN